MKIIKFLKINYTKCISILIILIGFHICYGLEVINPININWLMSAYHDWGQHYLGWAYFRNEPWHFPLGHIENFNYPAGTNIGYTDSIPLAALFFKSISFLLPDQFQYIGLWLFICHLLSAYFTIKIIKLYTNNALFTIVFVILVAFAPVLVYRGFHPALSSHWLIIASLYYYLIPVSLSNVINIEKKQFIILISSALINPYIFLMVFGFTIILPLKHYLYKIISLKQMSLFVFVSLLGVLLSWYLLGMIGINNQTNMEVLNSYGLYSFNLNSFYNSGGFSKFLPQLKQARDQQYEGYAYLGLGIIILFFLSITIYFYELLAFKKKWVNKNIALPLIFLASAMAIFSITNKVTLNEITIFEFKIPDLLNKLGGVFRACGRFIWLFYYLIFFFSFFIFIKSNLSKKLKTILLIVVVLIQIVDIKPLLTFRNLSNGNYEIKKMSEKKWTNITSKFKKIITYPCFENHLLTNLDYQDLCFIALKNNLPITTGYVARVTGEANKIFLDSLNISLSESKIKDNDLYITTPKYLNTFIPIIYAKKVKLGFLDGYYYLYSNNRKNISPVDFISKSKTDSIYREIDKSLKIKSINQQPIFQKEKINYNIEKTIINNNLINVQGWAYLKDTNSNLNDSIYVVLSNKKNTYISKSQLIKRPDVTANYKKGNVDNSGFQNTIFINNIAEDVYNLAIAIKDRNDQWTYEFSTQTPIIDLKKKIPPTTIKNIDFGKSEIIGNVDNYIVQANKVIISGWAAINKKDATNSTLKVILISDKENYQIETEKVLRQDVTDSYKNEFNYNESGFKVNVNKDFFKPGDYKIAIQVGNNKNQKGTFIYSNRIKIN